MGNETKFRDYMVREKERDKQRYQEGCLSKLPTIIEKLKSTGEPLSQSDRFCVDTLSVILTKIQMGSIKAEAEEE